MERRAEQTLNVKINADSSGLQAAVGLAQEKLGGFSEKVNSIGSNIGGLGGVFTSAQNIMSQFGITSGGLFDGLGMAGEVLTNVGSGFSAISGFATQLSGVIGNLGGIFGSITSPVTLVIAAIAALVAIMVYLFNTNEGFRNGVMSLISAIGGGLCAAFSAIVSVVQNIVSAIMPAAIAIMNVIMSIIQAAIPIIGSILSVAMSVISGIISVLGGFIGVVVDVFSGVFSVVQSVFSGIFAVVSSIMGNVKAFITAVFSAIQAVWGGLVGFVSNIFGGIESAVKDLVDGVKGFVNLVIKGINGAIGLINKIPGVNIGKIPLLAKGTDNWPGGFARINEGGRGELTYLPNGTQVIPHDISVKYAKEAARMNAGRGGSVDIENLFSNMTLQLTNQTYLDSKLLSKETARQVVRIISRDQKNQMKAVGNYA